MTGWSRSLARSRWSGTRLPLWETLERARRPWTKTRPSGTTNRLCRSVVYRTTLRADLSHWSRITGHVGNRCEPWWSTNWPTRPLTRWSHGPGRAGHWLTDWSGNWPHWSRRICNFRFEISWSLVSWRRRLFRLKYDKIRQFEQKYYLHRIWRSLRRAILAR